MKALDGIKVSRGFVSKDP